jgi:hypothetical protein
MRARGWRSWWPVRAWLVLTYRAGSVNESMQRPVRGSGWQGLAGTQTTRTGMPFVRLHGMTVPVVAVVDMATLTGVAADGRRRDGSWSAPRQRTGGGR